MPHVGLPWIKTVWAVLAKDALCEFRTRYAATSLAMFALVTLASLSMTMGGVALTPRLAAVLIWVVLFFCSMTGLSRSFVQEQEAGTLLVLRLYGGAQAVLFGKMLFNMALLAALTALVIPLFMIFMNMEVGQGSLLCVVLLLGDAGIAAVATLTAAMVSAARGRGALFTVLTFPVLLPQFLSSIGMTAQILAGLPPGRMELLFMAGYDIAIMAAASILFDYLWYE